MSIPSAGLRLRAALGARHPSRGGDVHRGLYALLYRSLPYRVESDVPYIAAATISLLAACIEPSRDHVFEAQGAIDTVIMARAHKLIATRLADWSLTPEKICKELGISRSRLYRIFEPVGGVSNYIRRQRLLKTRDALSDSADGSPISSIAEKWGFIEPSAYSRTFRKEFGMSPQDARAVGWFGTEDTVSERQSNGTAISLGNLLLGNPLSITSSISGRGGLRVEKCASPHM